MGWFLSTSLVSGNTAVLKRRRADTRLRQGNHKITPPRPPLTPPSCCFIGVLPTLCPPPAQPGVQCHHVQEPAPSVSSQLTSDTHYADSAHYSHGCHAAGAVSTGRSQRPQHGGHAQTPL